MTAAGIDVTPFSSALGAVISGVDLSAPLDDATFATIRGIGDLGIATLWSEHMSRGVHCAHAFEGFLQAR